MVGSNLAKTSKRNISRDGISFKNNRNVLPKTASVLAKHYYSTPNGRGVKPFIELIKPFIDIKDVEVTSIEFKQFLDNMFIEGDITTVLDSRQRAILTVDPRESFDFVVSAAFYGGEVKELVLFSFKNSNITINRTQYDAYADAANDAIEAVLNQMVTSVDANDVDSTNAGEVMIVAYKHVENWVNDVDGSLSAGYVVYNNVIDASINLLISLAAWKAEKAAVLGPAEWEALDMLNRWLNVVIPNSQTLLPVGVMFTKSGPVAQFAALLNLLDAADQLSTVGNPNGTVTIDITDVVSRFNNFLALEWGPYGECVCGGGFEFLVQTGVAIYEVGEPTYQIRSTTGTILASKTTTLKINDT